MMRILRMTLLALAVLTLLAACGDEPQAEPAPEVDETPEPADTPADTDEPLDMDALVSDADLGAPVRIVYDVETDAEPAMAGRMVLAQDADRWSMRSEMDELVSFVVVDGEEHYTCGQTNGDWTCFSGEQADLDAGPGEEVLTDDPAEGFDDWHYTDRDTIAERDAVCGTVAEADVCLDRATLQVLRFTSPEMEMIAVEVDDPTADDFALPAEPMDLGDGIPGAPDDFDLDDLEDLDLEELEDLDFDDLPDPTRIP